MRKWMSIILSFVMVLVVIGLVWFFFIRTGTMFGPEPPLTSDSGEKFGEEISKINLSMTQVLQFSCAG